MDNEMRPGMSSCRLLPAKSALCSLLTLFVAGPRGVVQQDAIQVDKGKGIATQTFEWIPHGDKSARKRARAHVTRGFRREKAALAKLESSKANDRLNPYPEDSRAGSSSKGQSNSPPEESDGLVEHDTSTSTLPDPSLACDSPRTSHDDNNDGIILQHTLSSARTDPFSALPLEVSSNAHALLDHCKCRLFIYYAPSRRHEIDILCRE
jgi:hypothetical protein